MLPMPSFAFTRPWLRVAFLAGATLVVGAGRAEAAEFRCTVRDVMVFANRIHVQCTTTTKDGTATIRYFAVPTTDAKLADRLLTVGTTALVSGRRFVAGFTSGDTSGNAFGCNASDCRKLAYFGME